MSDLYKEKENQTDAEMIDSHANDHCNHAEMIRQQQSEIERLSGELERQVTIAIFISFLLLFFSLECVFLLLIIVDHYLCHLLLCYFTHSKR